MDAIPAPPFDAKELFVQFDYVVIGAGSAGCAVAARLSENSSLRVALLEAGGRAWNPWLHVPVGYFKTMHNPATDWMYRTAPNPGLNGRSIEWPRGKVMGGSSAVNGLLYLRGQPEDYQHWRRLGNTGWGWDEVLPFFRKAEDWEHGGDALHGAGGPLAVSEMRVRRKVCDRFIEAAGRIGLPPNRDFNGPSQEGVGYFHLTTRKGLRCSSSTAYLSTARTRRNLAIFRRCLVRQVVFDGRRAIGARIERGRGQDTIRAAREVILSAGTIGSPQILQCSGVGPANLLAEKGLTVVADRPEVGENLQDHLQARAVFLTSEPTLNDEVNRLAGRIRIGLEFLFARSGPMTMGASQVGAFLRSGPEVATPDIQFHVQPLSSADPGHGLHPFSAFTASVCQLRPESRGHVRIASADCHAHPEIFPNYLATETHRRTVVAGIRFARRIAAEPPLSDVVTGEREPGATVQADEEILEWVRNRATTIYHPVGTCRMGADESAVVDASLRVRGVKGLRVADASIMPTITSGNTNAPAIMIGEKAAAMILESSRTQSES